MVIKDTVLLPTFQYVLLKMQENNLDVAIRQIAEYRDMQQSNEVDSVIVTKNALDEIIAWIMQYQESPDKAESVLSDKIKSNQKCNKCIVCRECFRLFWIELYKRYFDTEKYQELEKELKKGNSYVFQNIPKALRRHVESKTSASDYYWERCKNLRKMKSFRNVLVMLKGMSSSTPAILNGAFNTEAYVGGGIYLNWEGFGIAIDPGYHFIETMHEIGLSVLDIDAVVITHEHIDHSNDIRILDDLNYSLHRFGKEKHRISWYFDRITYGVVKQFQKSNSGFDKSLNSLYMIDPQKQLMYTDAGEVNISDGLMLESGDAQEQIAMEVVSTYHEQRNKKYLQHTFGCSFLLQEGRERRKVFYTSDTAYRDEIGQMAANSDVIIANISSVYEDDLLMDKPKDKHLGYMGCYKLLESTGEVLPKLFLISEFWNAKSDIRYDIARFLENQTEKNVLHGNMKTRVIPAEVGLQVNLKTIQMMCSSCHSFTDDFIVLKPSQEYEKIKYICKNCCY